MNILLGLWFQHGTVDYTGKRIQTASSHRYKHTDTQPRFPFRECRSIISYVTYLSPARAKTVRFLTRHLRLQHPWVQTTPEEQRNYVAVSPQLILSNRDVLRRPGELTSPIVAAPSRSICYVFGAPTPCRGMVWAVIVDPSRGLFVFAILY